jgi:RecA-family ATPase
MYFLRAGGSLRHAQWFDFFVRGDINVSDTHQMPEIPCRVSDEIASWRRVLAHTVGDKRGNFHHAAVDLSRLGANETPLTTQVILDNLAVMARTAGIEDDEALDIIAQATPLRFADIGAWAAQEPPPREWAVPDRFPLRSVSLLSGEGSVGKSIALMQLAAAHVLGKDWLGTLPELGPALYVNAEDEEGELHRRLADIAAHYGASLSDLKNHLHLLPLVGEDAVLGYPDRSGLIKPTPLFDKLTDAAGDIRPKLIALDTAADIYAGNENDRAQVRQFMSLMRRLAIAGNSAVVIAGHPSITGISSGSGLSGSTAWHNSARARAYMRALKVENGVPPEKHLRVIEFLKSNYGPVAETMTVRWRNGVFVPEPKAGSFEQLARDTNANEVFLQLLGRFNRQGRNVGDKRGHSYAPAHFAKEQEAKAGNLRSSDLADAMLRLFAENKIHLESYGRPSRQASRLVSGPASEPQQ